MTKILAAAIVLGLAALTQSASANSAHSINHGQKFSMSHNAGFARPVIYKHVSIRPIVVKHVVFKPAAQRIYKPIVIQHVFHKPTYRPAAYVPTHAGYQPSYHAPKYRYFPYTTYGYDSAPKDCSLMLYKSDYGLVRKVWRCVEVEKVEAAPVKIIVRSLEKQIIEKRVIEKRSIEKDAPTEKEAPTDDTLPPK